MSPLNTIPSNVDVTLQDGAQIKATTLGWNTTNKNLLKSSLTTRVGIIGADSILEMRRESLSVDATGPHCINLRGVTKFDVEGITMKNASGDGMHVGADTTVGRVECEDGRITRCTADGARRNGINITAARRLTIEDCILQNATGTGAQSGLNIEPANAADPIVSLTVRGCLARSNAGAGFIVNLNNLTTSSDPVSILIDECKTQGTTVQAVYVDIDANTDAGPGGTIEFRDCTFAGGTTYGASIRYDIATDYVVKFTRCTFINNATSNAESPINLQIKDQGFGASSVGEVIFQDCVVRDTVLRVPVQVQVSTDLEDTDLHVRGTITVINPALGTTGIVDVGAPNLKVSLSTTLRDMPNSDASLRAVVNMNGFAASEPVSQWATAAKIITDFAVDIDDFPDDQILTYYSAMEQIAENNPELLNWTGRYISGRRLEGTGMPNPVLDRFPHEAVDVAVINPAYVGFGGNTDWVDISVAAARTEFANAIADQVDAAWRPVLFLDNFAHPGTLPSGFTWADTCAFLTLLKERMTSRKTRIIANIAGVAYAWSTADMGAIIAATDALAFELFFHPNTHVNATLMNNEIAAQRRFLESGKMVIAIPVAQGGFTQLENATAQAAFCMMIRNPGHRLFCALGADQAVPAWNNWPTQLGPPTAEYVITGNVTTISRTFRNGSISIHVPTRVVTVS